MSRMTRGCAGTAAALAAGLALAGPALAQGNPDAADQVLAAHCATCHQVPGYPEPTRRYGLDAPAFQTIADNGSWYTRPRLLWILRDTHYPMDTFVLSTTDVDNVVAYILRLGTE